jgi:hypothetical protein
MRLSFSFARLRLRHLHWWGYVGVALLTSGLMWYLFGPLLADPNNYFMENGGDGIQTYFAMSYYGLHGQGLQFLGMNYPYGDHMNYPNMQPLLAFVIGWLQRHGIPAGRYTIGIINSLALLALAVSPLVMYAILRRTRLPVVYAGIMAIIIIFLSPQLTRLGGHVTLSYPCFLPLLWYFIIRMQEAPNQWRWYVWFVVSSLFIGAVMPYFMAGGSLLAFAHIVVLAWQRRRPGPLLWRMALAAVLPLLVFRGWLWATDLVTDRPPNPWGLLAYNATPAGVFVPHLLPLSTVWQALFPTDMPGLEGLSYVGLVCGGILLVSALRALWQSRRGQLKQLKRLARPALPAHLAAGMWAALLILVYSFGYPFKWPALTWLIDYSGPLKQFRSLGRFAWLFYYVASVYAAYYLYRLWRYQRRRRVALTALPWIPLLLLLWASEAWINVADRAKAIVAYPGASQFLSPDHPLVQRLSWASRQPSDFQAILPLPYMNKGTDKIDLTGSPGSIYQSEWLACATGLPMLATYFSRASVGHMLNHVQLLASPMVEKELLHDFPSTKPLLLVVASDGKLTPGEQRLVAIAKPLLTTPEVSLYELPLAALAATDLPQERAKAEALWPTLPQRPDGLRCTTAKGVFYQSFDQSPDRRDRLGAGGGALHEPTETNSVFYDGPLPTPADTGRYEASVWIYGKTDYGYGYLKVITYQGQQELSSQYMDGYVATEISHDWLRINVPFRMPAGADRVQILCGNRDLLADDFILRPLDTDVYYQVNKGGKLRLVKNGYLLEP